MSALVPSSFEQAIRILNEARSQSPSEISRALFDQYRTAQPAFRDALVLALIGEFAANNARQRFAPSDQERVAS